MRKFQFAGFLAVVGGVLALTAGTAGAAVPVAGPDTAKTPQDTIVYVDVLANDRGAGGEAIDPSSLNINEFPNNGDLAVTTDAKLAYHPLAGFNGTDTFSYLVCSSVNVVDCATGTVTVAVGNPAATTTTTTMPVPVTDPAPVTGSADPTLPRTGAATAVLAMLGFALCGVGLAMSRKSRTEV
jgi:hypothetical protein